MSDFQSHVFPVMAREDLVLKRKKKKGLVERKVTWILNG
jgi:hypothetical protein